MSAASPGVHAAGSFVLTSPSFIAGGTLPLAQVYNAHGCHGGNRAPVLSWSGEPAGTRGFAVTLFDPDARSGRGFWHWLVWNLPVGMHTLTPETFPEGALDGRTDFGDPSYDGPCPPPGEPPHHYVFTVYALSVPSADLTAWTSGDEVRTYLMQHALGSASLTGRYGR